MMADSPSAKYHFERSKLIKERCTHESRMTLFGVSGEVLRELNHQKEP
jgi:hypothetical protein